MFFPTADSDSTFRIAIAVIAGVVTVLMAVATFVLLRSENKKDSPTPPNDEPKPIPPVEMSVASPPKEKPEDALPSIPSVGDVPAPPPKEIPEYDLPAIPSDEIVAAPAPKERGRVEFQLNQGVTRVIRLLDQIPY